MHDELTDLDPREGLDENPYELTDDETRGQDYDALHPGDLCDWCHAPLDADGMCDEKCRSRAAENSRPTCAWCGSPDLLTQDYDFGRDPETGYHDAGTRVTCLACGRTDEL